MGKQKIVYIGPKEFKRDTVTGSRQVFPRNKPIEVSDEVAAVLLRFGQVFVEEDAFEDVMKAREEKAKAEAEAEALAQAEAEKLQKEADMTVTIGGEVIDLAKMNTPKLATLVESIDGLTLEAKGAQESAPDYKKRVRDAIRAMSESEDGDEDQ